MSDRRVSAAANAMNEECSKGELIDMLLKAWDEIRELKGQIEFKDEALSNVGYAMIYTEGGGEVEYEGSGCGDVAAAIMALHEDPEEEHG